MHAQASAIVRNSLLANSSLRRTSRRGGEKREQASGCGQAAELHEGVQRVVARAKSLTRCRPPPGAVAASGSALELGRMRARDRSHTQTHIGVCWRKQADKQTDSCAIGRRQRRRPHSMARREQARRASESLHVLPRRKFKFKFESHLHHTDSTQSIGGNIPANPSAS